MRFLQKLILLVGQVFLSNHNVVGKMSHTVDVSPSPATGFSVCCITWYIVALSFRGACFLVVDVPNENAVNVIFAVISLGSVATFAISLHIKHERVRNKVLKSLIFNIVGVIRSTYFLAASRPQ